ncbi:SUMF1/EgtB/PvdO family nonheme iron enzyme [Altererythrobacter aerius]|uniref:SUMF1/EgtB/PvdO family nonheme iron enzyme n=1 Tax=Tsuneonella aeria TaxID=1837929 RepID=A0A6I4TC31_9SPHN|nr:formylglycine-generating enzyme family protein [Tsuneonella aeria]MXO74314.1 SUMF1/EgtB/PvdO family nonheme iron enzyme [Tsuneonella aeria]
MMGEMLRVPGGRFWMGSDCHYPEEGPAHEVEVDPFEIDLTPVTNDQFAAFVADTGYVTFAETAPDPANYPGMPPEMARAGSLVFTPPRERTGLADPFAWWGFEFGADWRRPYGTGSDLAGLADHPVVHIALADAEAYATWAGKRLPSEAEWEFAARGGLDRNDYAWGREFEPGGKPQANYWQGEFPHQNLLTDGFARTSPVRAFPANGFGLFDMIGNVWEWTADWYADRHATPSASPCCIPRNPRGGDEGTSHDPCTPDMAIGRRVLKGGSHLCAANYCQRYRPAARYAQPVDTSTSHVGFRCARSL